VTLDGHACDITDPAAVTTLRDQLAGVIEIEVLVNSAGVMSERTAKTLRATAVEWRRVLAINLDAPFYFMNTFVPAMVERREGRVINVTACLGRFSGPGNTGGLAPYRISKSGLNALTKNLAHELGMGSRGVFVDAVCPGHCRTDMGGPDAPRSAKEGADTIVWLATRPKDEAAKQTGLLWEDRQVVPW
jgi:NAD(P)-dependent dehydrogenase (short-subunit alcohol dehydrogenase family)